MATFYRKIISAALLCFHFNIALAATFEGLVGVDYQPNHYPGTNTLNFHDVFYVGTNASGQAITNVYAELVQLKQAGFNTVRSYQTTDYSWIDIINQANALGMKVIYEAVIPQLPADTSYAGGCPVAPANQDYIPCAQSLLNTVINQVGTSVFQNTVVLVFAGHENYCEAGNVTSPCNNPITSNVAYLTSAVSSLQTTLTTAGITSVPVGSALVSGNLTTPSVAIANDMQTLINSYSADAPLAFDPYPFQWGVTPASAVWNTPYAPPTVQATNSFAWDYIQVIGSTSPAALPVAVAQPFYVAPRVLMAAETGWATQGSTGDYACNSPGPCLPSVANATTYYQALYQSNTANFISTAGYPAAVLAFEAYDEPNKGSASAEGHYGLFDTNCNQKAAGLVPNNLLVASSGCQGFSGGALMTIVGFAHPYHLAIKQTNPVTGLDASIAITGTGIAGPLADAPWPVYLVFPGATITIRGNPSCTSTVQSVNSAQQISFSGSCNCTNNANNCYY